MTSAEITKQIRLMILEERARHLGPKDFTQAQTDAINFMAHLLSSAAPEYFEKKVSLQPKNTNIHAFELPSDCLSLKSLWDYDGDASVITGAATNAGVIQITSVAHGFTDEDVVTIHGVLGTTEANDTWQINYVDADTFDLVGSTFANAWTSGGKAFKESADTYKYPIDRKPSKFQDAFSETKFYLKEDEIIIDNPDFENDLIALYRYLPATLEEIPSRMHYGIWAYGTIQLIYVPAPTTTQDGGRSYHPDHATLKKNLKHCEGLWAMAQKMAMDFRPVLGSSNISDVPAVKKWL